MQYTLSLPRRVKGGTLSGDNEQDWFIKVDLKYSWQCKSQFLAL